MSEIPPLIFEKRLNMLAPVNPAAREAMLGVQGRVTIKITRATANQKRRGLYWTVAGIAADLLNDKAGTNLTEAELHDITRRKLGLFDEIALPSGDVHIRYHSTADRAMPEPQRAAYTTRAFKLWSNWLGVQVEDLGSEGERA